MHEDDKDSAEDRSGEAEESAESNSSFDIRIVDDEDNAIEGAGVMLSYTALLEGGVTETIRTDEDGRAEFEGYRDGEVKVFVNGSYVDTYDVSDGDEITITV